MDQDKVQQAEFRRDYTSKVNRALSRGTITPEERQAIREEAARREAELVKDRMYRSAQMRGFGHPQLSP